MKLKAMIVILNLEVRRFLCRSLLADHSNDDSITQAQEKVNQRSLEGHSDPTDESKTVLPPLRNRFMIKATEDSDDEGDKHADRFRHRQKGNTIR